MISQFSKSIVKLTGKIHQQFLGIFFQQKVLLSKWLFSVTFTFHLLLDVNPVILTQIEEAA